MDSERQGGLRTCFHGCYPHGFAGELKAIIYLAWPTVCMKLLLLSHDMLVPECFNDINACQ